MSLVLANFNDFAETIEKPLDQEQFRGGGGYPPEAPPREVKLRRVTGSEMLKNIVFIRKTCNLPSCGSRLPRSAGKICKSFVQGKDLSVSKGFV